jgi:integrase/recombinase XerD
VLTLLSRLGLRAGEVRALRLEDIDWRAAEIMIRGKGSRQEQLPHPVDVGEALADWLRDGRQSGSLAALDLSRSASQTSCVCRAFT